MLHRIWIPVRDGDPRAYGIFRRHYTFSARRRSRSADTRFAGPGAKIVLMTADCRNLFVWRRFIEQGQSEPRGIYCSVFRREGGPWLASDMIVEAEGWAWRRWPNQRLYTHVNPRRVRSANPGYCFKRAGWTVCRHTTKV